MLDGERPVFPGVSTPVATPDAGRAAVAAQHARGVDLIKVYNNLSAAVLRAVAAAAHGRGMPVFGHVPRAAGRARALHDAVDAGLDVIAHGEELFFTHFYGATDSLLALGRVPHVSSEDLPRVAAGLRAAEVAVIPNLSFVEMIRRRLADGDAVLRDPESRHLHPAVRASWRGDDLRGRADRARFALREEAKREFLYGGAVRALRDHGVTLLLGTDASAAGMYPGASAHLELRELVRAGLTPYEALSAATALPGRFASRWGWQTVPSGVVAGRARGPRPRARRPPARRRRAA